jgi:hypothetical protein
MVGVILGVQAATIFFLLCGLVRLLREMGRLRQAQQLWEERLEVLAREVGLAQGEIAHPEALGGVKSEAGAESAPPALPRTEAVEGWQVGIRDWVAGESGVGTTADGGVMLEGERQLLRNLARLQRETAPRGREGFAGQRPGRRTSPGTGGARPGVRRAAPSVA